MDSPAGCAYSIRFGEFELDPLTRELRTNGQTTSLQEQPFQILLALLERPGELVTRDELTKRLWPSGASIDCEHRLNTAVNRLRAVLKDSTEHPRFIESLPRRGYRFVAEVAFDRVPKPKLLLQQESPASEATESKSTDTAGGLLGSAAHLPESVDRRSGNRRRRTTAVAAILVLLLSAAVITTVAHFRATPQPTGRRSIVLADFINRTGDPVFEESLRQGLAIQLEQSPFLVVESGERLVQTLSLMGQPADAAVTPQIAGDICRRIGGFAWLDGSIAQVDDEYVVGLRAASCESNQDLARVQVTAANKREVLKELGSAVQEIRGRLGEALSTMKKFNTPLDQATTSSLEALRAYTLGRKALWKREDSTAVSLFLRATQLDPNFAMAYAYLGMSYMNLGETILAAENTRKAYDLRARVSERERFYIESHYLHNVRGDLLKAREVYELWSQTYPEDLVPVSNLAEIYTQFGLYENALAEDLRASRIEPTNASNYSDRVADYLYLNNVGAAQTVAEQALARGLDSPRLHIGLYLLAFQRNDKVGMAKQVSWSAGKAGVEDKFLALDAETAAYTGRLATARGLSRRAVAAAQNSVYREAAATYEVSSALREAFIGEAVDARRGVIAALSISRGRDVEATAALTLSLIGEVAQSQKIVSDLDERFPEDTIVQLNYLPTVRGQLALDNHDPAKALGAIEAAAMYELGDPGDLMMTPTVMCAVYVRGEAYLAANDGNKAAIEFTKILNHPGVFQNKLIGALAYLGIARAFELQDDVARARAAYEEFFALWREADADIPILKQARREYSTVSQLLRGEARATGRHAPARRN